MAFMVHCCIETSETRNTNKLWKSVLWSDGCKFEICCSSCLCEMQRTWTDSVCMCIFHHEDWMRCWYDDDTSGNLFKIQGTLKLAGYHDILQWHAILSGLFSATMVCFSLGEWPKTNLLTFLHPKCLGSTIFIRSEFSIESNDQIWIFSIFNNFRWHKLYIT